jgi:transglutaminase-like putative cysteine protease
MIGFFFRVFARLLFLALCLCSVPAMYSAEPKPVSFEIAAVPAWVKPAEPVIPVSIDAENAGISYLLLEQQEQVEPKASYYHEVRQITSENGVQNGAAISTSFDPSFQKLTFHFIRLRRNGVTTERLDRSRISLLQREKDMELFLFDGAFTALCQLEDVRVGDVVEFAYTTEGANPAKKGKFSKTLATDWYYPVRRAVTRVVYPAHRKLSFRVQNRAITPSVTTARGVTEWLLDQANVPRRKADADTPAGYDPCGWVQISEYATWEDVVDWAVPLYQADGHFSNDLEAEIGKLKGIADSEQRILAALRFVQDEIRYLGLESGGGSYKPTAPGEVLRRRFGDCKDKACLLSVLLRQTGIDATPAFVSDVYRSTVAERLPSPGDFDHVIVRVQIDATTHWLDATRSNQRGPLSQISVGNFGYALVLRPGSKALTAFAPPPDSLPKKKVTENYRFPAPGGTAHLEVSSAYHGRWAERTRAQFRENGREKIQKEYMQYYARRFPGIRTEKSLQYEEVPGENACKTREFYLIQDVWQFNNEKKQYEVFLYPGDLSHDMGSPGSSRRDDPLELDHPLTANQEINAEMFEDWAMQGENQNIANSFYRFRHEAITKGRHLQFNYAYESLVDRVAVADLPRYNTELTKLKDTLGYTLSYNTPAQMNSVRKWFDQINWPISVLLVCVLIVAMFISAWLIYFSMLPAPIPPPTLAVRPMEGIGGWLILVAIHHILRPIVFIFNLVMLFPTVLHLGNWRLLTEPGQAAFHPSWAPALLFELCYNSLCLVFSGLLLILFFQKRALWRWCYVVFLVVFALGVGIDTHLTQQIPAAGGTLDGNIRDLFQVIVAAAVWIPYCFVSKRVRATFRY